MYKKEYEKIAMGLLSFMPGDKSVKKTQQVIKHYNNRENWKLFLWKTGFNRFVGVIGVEKDGKDIYLHDLTVDPSFRNEGLAHVMIEALEAQFSTHLTGLKQTEHFLQYCRENNL